MVWKVYHRNGACAHLCFAALHHRDNYFVVKRRLRITFVSLFDMIWKHCYNSNVSLIHPRSECNVATLASHNPPMLRNPWFKWHQAVAILTGAEHQSTLKIFKINASGVHKSTSLFEAVTSANVNDQLAVAWPFYNSCTPFQADTSTRLNNTHINQLFA